MDRIFIDNLQVEGILGVHPHEQRALQKIRISASLTTDITQAAAADDVLKSVNYSTLTKDIILFIKQSHYRTIEALIEALAAKILTNERVESVWLRVEKPDAVPETETVGVEITRTK
jgi:7,8-dihydroneopterin aldolase/epimerase/oxygenase